MPLSEHEQRILEEIERRLAAEDPKFARSTRTMPRSPATGRIKRAVLGFVAGLGFLIAGLFVPDLLLPLGLAGFTVMLLSVLVGSRASRDLARVSVMRTNTSRTWLGNVEERWKKRFGGTDPRD